MPRMYEAIRDKCESAGGSASTCKTKAAKIFNARRPAGTAPVTRNYEKTKRGYHKVKSLLRKAFPRD